MKLSRSKAALKEEPIFRILLFIFILFLLVAFITGLNEFLSKLLEFKIDPISQASALALACAINSEAAGYINDYTCENSEITSNAGSVTIEPLYTFDDAINAIEAGKNNPTAMMIRDMRRIKRKVENVVTGLFGVKLAYAEEKPVAYRFGNSVVVCANSTLLSKDALWSNPASKDEKITKYYSELNDNEFRCKVFNFELKQRESNYVNIETRAYPAFYDPDIILYYNSFPEGEEVGWIESEESADLLGNVIIAGALNLVFWGVAEAPAKLVKTFVYRSFMAERRLLGTSAIKTVISKIGRRGARISAQDVMKEFMENAGEYLEKDFSSFLMYDLRGMSSAFTIYPEASKEAGVIFKNALKRGKSIREAIDEVDNYLKSVDSSLALTPTEKKTLQYTYGKLYDLARAVEKGTISPSRAKVILDTDNTVVKGFFRKRETIDTLEYIEKTGNGYDEFVSLLRSELSSNPAFKSAFIEGIQKSMKPFHFKEMISRGLLRKLAGDRTFKEGFKDYLKFTAKNDHFHFWVIEAADEAGVLDQIIPEDDPVRQWALSTFECRKLVGAGMVKSYASCAIAGILYTMNRVVDVQNVKKMVSKHNAIVVYSPAKINIGIVEFQSSPEHATEVINLVPEASKYLIFLRRDASFLNLIPLPGKDVRMYFASPCKVDLLVTKGDEARRCSVTFYTEDLCKQNINQTYGCKGINSGSPVDPDDPSTTITIEDYFGVSEIGDIDEFDDDYIYSKLKSYYHNHIEKQSVAKNDYQKKREICIAALNLCGLLPDPNDYDSMTSTSICDNVRENWVTSTVKYKSCALLAWKLGAGGLYLKTSGYPNVLYPTQQAILCVGNCSTSSPLWGVFEEGYLAATTYYDSSIFRWYLEGKVEEISPSAPLKVWCPVPDLFESLSESFASFFLGWQKDGYDMPQMYILVVNASSTSNNYCYYGAESGTNMIEKARVSLVVGVTEAVTIGLLGGLTGGLGLIAAGAVHFAAGAIEAAAYANIDSRYYWPNNPSLPA